MKLHWLQNLKNEIWCVDLEPLSKGRAFWIRFARILILISQGFSKSQIQQGASSLTYYSLIAIVPIIALLIGIARGFNLEAALKKWIFGLFPEQKEIINKIFDFAGTSLETANQGLIAGIGILLLLWAGMKIFLYIEKVLNTIWEVEEGRSFARRFADYLAIMFLFPLVVLLASGISVYISAAFSEFMKSGFLERVGPYFLFLLNLIPTFFTCMILTLLYIFMPDTRVRFLPALWAGIIAGLTYQIVQWLYLYFQIGATRYNAIYGTFAALPLFLVWIHLSWVIVLIGAKISFAFQNVNAFDFISEKSELSHRFKTIFYLRITHFCVKYFCEGKAPPSAIVISNKLSIPLPLVKTFLSQLIKAGVLSEVKKEKDQDSVYQPSRSVEQLTIKRVLDIISSSGEEIPLPPSHELDLILRSLEKFNLAIEASDGNILLKDI